MSYPILAASNTWYKSSTARSAITEINIVNSYTITGSETETWNADVDDSGSIKCYLNGTVLTIAGNGSGKIAMNADSSWLFSYAISGASESDKVFISCTAINGLDLFDSSAVTNMRNIFAYCLALTELDLSTWDVSNVTTLRFAFGAHNSVGTMSLTTLNLTGWNITNKCTSIRAMCQFCSALTSINVSNWDVSGVTEANHAFAYCSSLKSIPVSNWNTGACTSMTYMFSYCTSLESIDVSNWDVSSVTNMNSMFSMNNYGDNPPPITEIDVSNWNVSNVTDMGWMFYGLGNLKTINVANWDVSKVESFHHMFAHDRSLVIHGYENWNLASCKHLNAIFHASARTEWDLSNWDVSGVENFGQMFENSKAVIIHGLNKWNTSSGKTFNEMFGGCTNLIELDLSSFDTTNADDTYVDPKRNQTVPGGMYNMFGQMFYNEDGSLNDYYYLRSLKKVILGEKFNFKGNGSCKPCSLPNHVFGHISGEDGNWYSAKNIVAYAPGEVPSLTAETYYASKELIETKGLVQYGTLAKISNAIRGITGKENVIKPSEMAQAISGMTSSSSAEYLAQVLNLEITELSSEQIYTKLPEYFQYGNTNLTKVDLPNLTALRGATFSGCTKLTEVNLPSVTTMSASNFPNTAITKLYMPSLETITSWGWNFQNCPLTKVYFPKLTTLTSNDFNRCYYLTTLILGAETICNLPNVDVFSETPIAGNTNKTNGEMGYVYVPSALINEYKVAENWSTYANQIRAIEDYPEVLEGWS